MDAKKLVEDNCVRAFCHYDEKAMIYTVYVTEGLPSNYRVKGNGYTEESAWNDAALNMRLAS